MDSGKISSLIMNGMRQEKTAKEEGAKALRQLRREQIGRVILTLEQWSNSYYHVRVGFCDASQTYPMPCNSKLEGRRTFKAFFRAAAALILDGKDLYCSYIIAEAMEQGWTPHG